MRTHSRSLNGSEISDGGSMTMPRGMSTALRTSDSTTTIFVNAVHMSRIAGATPSAVMSAMIETTWLGCPGTFAETWGSLGLVGPVGFAGAFGPDAETDAMAGAETDADAV